VGADQQVAEGFALGGADAEGFGEAAEGGVGDAAGAGLGFELGQLRQAGCGSGLGWAPVAVGVGAAGALVVVGG
jgi:hypothetical protein